MNLHKVKVMIQLLVVLQLQLYDQKMKVQCLAFVNLANFKHSK